MKSTLLEAHAPKQEEGGGGGGGGGGGTRDWLQENKFKETTPTSVKNNLELSLGSSLTTTTTNRDVIMRMSTASGGEPKAAAAGRFMTTLNGLVLNGLAGTKRPWFTDASPSCSVAAGFIHPWSLAARQQKAVFEQAHQRSNPSSTTPAVPRFTTPAPPPVVGWPPVRASRRNLVSPVKPEMDGEKEAKKAKVTEDGGGEKKKLPDQVRPAAMFVKVNMEGFAVGRKINLKAHDSYDSLSRALQKMFTNFLSTNYSNSAQEEQDEDPNSDYILLYEDNEGDRMLVGDVPWKLFMTSVKRLLIAHSPKTPKSDDEKATDEQN